MWLRKEKYIKKYRTNEVIYNVALEREDIGLPWHGALLQIYLILERCLMEATRNLDPHDRIRVYINQQHFEKPIVLHMREVRNLTANDVISQIEKMLQSQMDLKIDSSFEIPIATMRMPRGGGRSHLIKKSVITKKKKKTVYVWQGQLLSRKHITMLTVVRSRKSKRRKH